MFPPVIETDRLRLEQTCHENLKIREYYEVCSADPNIEKVTKYLPWTPHDHPHESATFLEGREEAWEERSSADYLVRTKKPHPEVSPRVVPDDEYGPFAGQTGLGLDWDRNLASLGLWLRRPFWGRGYSGERAMALMSLAFDRLDVAVVSVSHEPNNERSRGAIEKYIERVGGRREGHLRNYMENGNGPVDQVRYTVSQEEWDDNKPDELGVRFMEADQGG